MIPKILLVASTSNTRNGSYLQLLPILQKYQDRIIWYSPERMSISTEAEQLPYPHRQGRTFRRLSRLGEKIIFLRELLNLYILSKFFLWRNLPYFRRERVEIVWVLASGIPMIAGLSAAEALKVPVMVSVFDDQIATGFSNTGLKGNLAFKLLTEKPFVRLMRRSRICGAISESMSSHYRDHYQLKSLVLYAGPDLSKLALPPVYSALSDEIVIASLGTVYADLDNEWRAFIASIQILNQLFGYQRVHVIHIGNLAESLRSAEITVTGWLDEEEVARALTTAHLCISIFPFGEASKLHAMTAFPTKFRNYLQSQRPIVALAPNNASTARFVNQYHCGISCSSLNPADIAAQIHSLITTQEAYERAVQGMASAAQALSLDQLFRNFELFVESALATE